MGIFSFQIDVLVGFIVYLALLIPSNYAASLSTTQVGLGVMCMGQDLLSNWVLQCDDQPLLIIQTSDGTISAHVMSDMLNNTDKGNQKDQHDHITKPIMELPTDNHKRAEFEQDLSDINISLRELHNIRPKEMLKRGRIQHYHGFDDEFERIVFGFI